MPVVRNPKASKSNEDQTSTSGPEASEGMNNQPGNCKFPRETIQLRRSLRLASRYKYAVPSDKPIVPSRRLLERQGPRRAINTFKPVNPADLAEQPAWPEFETGPHGARSLQREYSFVLVDCGTHCEMVSPKTVNQFSRVPQCFGTLAPYHNFGSHIGEEELRRKLRARIVKKVDEEANATTQESTASSTSQTRKRGRSDDDDEEDRAANNVKRPVKKDKVTKVRSAKT